MQFRPVEHDSSAVASAGLVNTLHGPHRKAPKSPSSMVLQPGVLQSLTQGNQQTSKTRRTSRKPGQGSLPVDLDPEPINYLRLRRTEQSHQALLRNQQVAHEILRPSSPPPVAAKKPKKRRDQRILELQQTAEAVDHDIHSAVDEFFTRTNAKDKSHARDTAAQFAVHLQKLHREQLNAQQQSHRATQQVKQIFTQVRNNISVLAKFTPLFRIYDRHKLAQRWQRWLVFIEWHRQEMVRLQQLSPCAMQIQRAFRYKREQWRLERERLELAKAQSKAAEKIQKSARYWLFRLAIMHRTDARYARRLQAAWKGRCVRKQVKQDLKHWLRALLTSLSPTGNLHRLHEITHHNPHLTPILNRMLTLAMETHVNVGGRSAYMPRHASIAAQQAAIPVLTTRKELILAIHELRAIIAERENRILAAKSAMLEELVATRIEKEQQAEMIKRRKLAAVQERLAESRELAAMKKAEEDIRQHLRMLKTLDTDRLVHERVRLRRREEAENERMVIKEYELRYILAESRRRRLDEEKRRLEVQKREQFLQDQAKTQMEDALHKMKEDVMKRHQLEQERLLNRAAQQARWAELSAEQQEKARRRQDVKERLLDLENQRLEAERIARDTERQETIRKKEAQRSRKHEELIREDRERQLMAEAESASRKAHFLAKKESHSSHWQTKRDHEMSKYSLDPLQFENVRTYRQVEERRRRELFSMRQEDDLAHKIHERERKEEYFRLCRERRRLRLAEQEKERVEMNVMGVEDQLECERLLGVRKAEEYKRDLAHMKDLAQSAERKEQRRIGEAKERKQMHDEEMEQRRTQQAIDLRDSLHESHERRTMTEEELSQRQVDSLIRAQRAKRLRDQRTLRMMKEDVASMHRQEWESEGSKLEALLWPAETYSVFPMAPNLHLELLRTNVEVLQKLTSGQLRIPPFDLDYDAAQAHLSTESTMTPDAIPHRKRRPRKFFYHEFFEEDPLLIRLKAEHALRQLPPPPPEQGFKRAHERWKKLALHFLGHLWSLEASRKGCLLMHNKQYDAACIVLLDAVHGWPQSKSSRVSPALLRQLARCYLRRWQLCFDRNLLEKSRYYFQEASGHVVLLSSPSFLQEIAFVLECLGEYRHAAELLAGIITCFPRYSALSEVIFRGGVVLASLQQYRQSREYLLHVMDDKPFGWQSYELLFLVARILHLEGALSKKLCSIAYEEAFRHNNKRKPGESTYPTWQEWVRASDTWRHFGDLCFARSEFFLASDAYEQMGKRQRHKLTELQARRQRVQRETMATSKSLRRPEIEEAADPLRIARASAMLNDRPKVQAALTRWLAAECYRDRVYARFCQWPLVRWRLLGFDNMPTRVAEEQDRQEQERVLTAQIKQREIDEQRRQILLMRENKARARTAA